MGEGGRAQRLWTQGSHGSNCIQCHCVQYLSGEKFPNLLVVMTTIEPIIFGCKMCGSTFISLVHNSPPPLVLHGPVACGNISEIYLHVCQDLKFIKVIKSEILSLCQELTVFIIIIVSHLFEYYFVI